MHIELRYVTRFLYPSEVWDSHNALRARPVDDEYQRTSSYEVSIQPAARVFTYVDSWGTEVNTFSVTEPHDELVVSAWAVVDTKARPSPPTDVPLDALADDDFREPRWLYLQPSTHVTWDPALREAAAGLAAGVDDVRSAIQSIAGHVHDRLEYRPGATVVGTPVGDIWAGEGGVCQDFSHLVIALLRSVGVPARYVSGYLYAADPHATDPHDEGEIVVQTHAWVEACVPGWGWWAIDPTNRTVVGERHVTIGRGRDYEDVMPLRGVYHGDTEATLAVEVTMGHRIVSVDRLPELTVDQ